MYRFAVEVEALDLASLDYRASASRVLDGTEEVW